MYSCCVSFFVGVIMIVCGFFILLLINCINGNKNVWDFFVFVWDWLIKFVFFSIFGIIWFWILVGFLKLRFFIVLIKLDFRLNCLNGCFVMIWFFYMFIFIIIKYKCVILNKNIKILKF